MWLFFGKNGNIILFARDTFAWFTSQDEVTNRLSASANYGVTIAEDFTPPENLVPGQKVNKDVSIVNTGNIDALVRVHLEGAMNVLKENAVSSEIDIKTGFGSTTLTDVADADLIALGLTKKDEKGNFYRTLSKTERPNPKLAGDTEDTASDSAVIENSEDNTYSEVKTVQAGGYLAYASGNFEFTPENAGYTYIATDGKTVTQSSATEVASTAIKDSWTNGAGLAIDSDTFVPTSSGLFIFRRNITLTNKSGDDGTNAQEYEFSGYYADVDTANNTVTYYALHYLPNEDKKYNSDYVIYSTAQTAEENDNALTVTYETETISGETTTPDKTTPIKSVVPKSTKAYSDSYTRLTGLVGKYDKDTGDDATTGTVTFTNNKTDANEKVQVVANVANIGTDTEKWTALTETGSHTYFYYKNDVEEGDSTAKLVDSVQLMRQFQWEM